MLALLMLALLILGLAFVAGLIGATLAFVLDTWDPDIRGRAFDRLDFFAAPGDPLWDEFERTESHEGGF